MPRIHTLNARGNVMLPVLRDYFSWSDEHTFKEVQRFHRDCLDILKVKGINYDDLRSALADRNGPTSEFVEKFLNSDNLN